MPLHTWKICRIGGDSELDIHLLVCQPDPLCMGIPVDITPSVSSEPPSSLRVSSTSLVFGVPRPLPLAHLRWPRRPELWPVWQAACPGWCLVLVHGCQLPLSLLLLQRRRRRHHRDGTRASRQSTPMRSPTSMPSPQSGGSHTDRRASYTS